MGNNLGNLTFGGDRVSGTGETACAGIRCREVFDRLAVCHIDQFARVAKIQQVDLVREAGLHAMYPHQRAEVVKLGRKFALRATAGAADQDRKMPNTARVQAGPAG